MPGRDRKGKEMKEMHAKSEESSSGSCGVVTGGFDKGEPRQLEAVRASVRGTGRRSSAPPALGAKLQARRSCSERPKVSRERSRTSAALPGTAAGAGRVRNVKAALSSPSTTRRAAAW